MDKNLTVLSLFSALTTFAGALFSTVFSLYLWDRGFGLLDIAYLSAISTGVSLIFSRFFGILADSINKKPFIVAQGILISAAYFGFYLILRTYGVSLLSLEMLYALLGFATAVGTGAYMAATTTSLSRLNTGRATGTYMSFSMIGGTLGSFLSGYLAEYAGMDANSAFAASITLIGTGIVTVWYSEKNPNNVRADKSLFKKALKQAVNGKLRGNGSSLVLLLVIVTILSIANAIYFLAFSIKLYVMLGSKTAYGVVNGIGGLIGIFAPYFIGMLGDKVGKEKLLIAGFLIRDVFMLYLAFAWNLPVAIIFWTMPVWPLIYISLVSLTTEYAEVGAESEVQSIRNVIYSASSTIGSLISGYIASLVSLKENIYNMYAILFVGVMFYFVATILSILLLKRRNSHSLVEWASKHRNYSEISSEEQVK